MEDNKDDKARSKRASKNYTEQIPEVRELKEIDLSGSYSYAHYLRWKFEERIELIKGKIFEMSAPATFHQEVSRELFGALYIHLKGHKCKVFCAPFDIRFPRGSKADRDIYNVVQPDICVICDLRKLDRKGCIGAPDLVVEILSPGNSRKELRIKYELYQEFGVREYWIVDPNSKTILKHILSTSGIYVTEQFTVSGGILTSDLLPGFSLNFDEIFSSDVQP